MDQWDQHEGLDRCHMIMQHLESAFGSVDPEEGQHPSLWSGRARALYCKAYGAIAELYQAIGEWDDGCDYAKCRQCGVGMADAEKEFHAIYNCCINCFLQEDEKCSDSKPTKSS